MTAVIILVVLIILALLTRQYFIEKEEELLDEQIKEAERKLNSLLKEEHTSILESEVVDRKIALKKLNEKIKQVKEDYEIK